MKIRWFGHACFGIVSANGTRIITDPFDESVGYPMPDAEADIVTTSHGHFDHNHTKGIRAISAIYTSLANIMCRVSG